MTRENPQVNVRLPPDLFEVLEAAAFAQRLTPSTLLTDLAEEAISRIGEEASTQTAMRARREADTALDQTVSPITGRKTVRRIKRAE